MRRLASAFAIRICEKYYFYMSWLKFICSYCVLLNGGNIEDHGKTTYFEKQNLWNFKTNIVNNNFEFLGK